MNPISEIAKLNKTGKGGADISMPDRGTSTGLNGDTYGADLSVDATNTIGDMKGADSDSHFEDCPSC